MLTGVMKVKVSAQRWIVSRAAAVFGLSMAMLPMAAKGQEKDVQSISSSRVLIDYKVAKGAEPVTRVELWYSRDRGETWQRAKSYDKLQNPLTFDASQDGLYAFYVALHNARASMPPPTSAVMAHRWIRVDRTVPMVQVLGVSPDDRFDLNREIHIRWAAKDDFDSRPVSLHYRTGQTKSFRLIADSLTAEGSYRWTVPNDVTGRIEIKVSARDRANNRGHYVADWLRIEGDRAFRTDGAFVKTGERTIANRSEPENSQARANRAFPSIHSEPDAGGDRISDRAAIEAKKQYDLGGWHRQRGEYGVAIARYRDALRYDPEFVEARSELAGVLLLQNKVEHAEKEFRHILDMLPEHLPALRGMAFVQAKQRKYRSAHDTLQKLLSVVPNDAEAWLHFGDVCMFMGDRSLAREAWTKSRDLETASPRIKRRAGRRLEIYGAKRLVVDSTTEW